MMYSRGRYIYYEIILSVLDEIVSGSVAFLGLISATKDIISLPLMGLFFCQFHPPFDRIRDV